MIGIYGGTFDPIHYGHLRTAIEVKEIFSLEQIRLIPCRQPAHRASPDCTAEMRCQMVQLAIQAQSDLMLLDQREIERPGVSYMVDTMNSLAKDFPEQQLLLFIGADAFKGLTSWHQWQDLFDYAHIVVMTRPGYTVPVLEGFLANCMTDSREMMNEKQAGCLYFQKVTQLDISATAIRACFKQGKNPAYLLPDTVIDYIKSHKIYL